MLTKELNFDFPEDLIATEKVDPSRVMWVDPSGVNPCEITFNELLARIPAGDCLVVNDTRVIKRRVFAQELEILFLKEVEPQIWQVLFPAKNLKPGARIELPMGATAELLEKGRPQLLRVNRPLTAADFQQWGELPLPPYIQRARQQRHNRETDQNTYQTAWAKQDGSLAAPTASLHFKLADLEKLKNRGVNVCTLTLHVGLGTFLPVTTDQLSAHQMHGEQVEIPRGTWAVVQRAHLEGRGVWALGTTVARSLESASRGLLRESEAGFLGETRLFMTPGEPWRIVNRLLTNFHQPESTLLALVASFHSWDSVKLCYQWAVQRRFRLFSYGDFSAWIK